ncbi:Calpain-5 [Lamellibrachia satsuma]|nr:Calpain-5 [Lamellibrachia satsuma]
MLSFAHLFCGSRWLPLSPPVIMPVNYCSQKYSELKKKAQKTDILFVDNVFRASASSLSKNLEKYDGIEWKRPKDICSTPRFLDVNSTKDDMTEGQYGNPAFLAACSSLSTYSAFWEKVIPKAKEQDWGPKAAGIFHFVIWHHGEWLDIVVDDLLPTHDGKLIFTHSPENKDFWLPLLEKAYAKVLGSYDHLGEADMVEILEDFTGGLGEVSDISPDDDSQERLFRTLKEEVDNKSLMLAVISAPMFSNVGEPNSGGLLMGHGYGVTAVKRVTFAGTPLVKLVQEDKLNLIRLRDPWSTNGWTGKFGRCSEEWGVCKVSLQKKRGVTLIVDNEFWMTFDEFCHNFTHVVMCRQMKRMSCAVMHSEWAEPNKAGGCIEYTGTFLNNPQLLVATVHSPILFVFSVVDRDDEVVLALMQHVHNIKSDQRKFSWRPTMHMLAARLSQSAELTQFAKHSQSAEHSELAELSNPAKCSESANSSKPAKSSSHVVDKEWTIQTHRDCLTVGFTVLKVEVNRIYRLHKILDVVSTSVYKNIRRVVLRCRLASGRYIVVATTSKPQETGSFLMHIYTSSGSNAMELNMDKPTEGMLTRTCSCIPRCRHPLMLTQIVVFKATGLESGKTEPNPYCIISCEGQKVTTPVCKDSLKPEWNTGAIFYRRHPTSVPIKVQLWNKNMFVDTFLGEVILEGRTLVDQQEVKLPLYDRNFDLSAAITPDDTPKDKSCTTSHRDSAFVVLSLEYQFIKQP